MNKSELIDSVAEQTGLSKVDADRAISAFTQSITAALREGDTVALVGFGTFKVTKRAAREGRNPKTGATIEIAERNVPRFTAGKSLKDAVAK